MAKVNFMTSLIRPSHYSDHVKQVPNILAGGLMDTVRATYIAHY